MLMDFVINQYRKSMVFFKGQLIKLTLIVGVIFVIVIAVSAIYLKDHPEIIQNLMIEFMNMANNSGIINDSGEISSIGLMMNNMKACVMSIAIGLIPFIFLPLITLIMNAALIGAMFGLYSIMEISYLSLFAGLIPHGIFEIPALIISMTLGIYLCKETTMKLLGKRSDVKISEVCGSIFNFYVCVIVPLLIIAGIVEAYITPIIMEMTM